MVFHLTDLCPKCGGETNGYDTVKRKLKYGDRGSRTIYIPRVKCKKCGSVHRVIPDEVEPYTRYEKGIKEDFQLGYLDNDDMGYEEFPCEMTVLRWIREKCNE